MDIVLLSVSDRHQIIAPNAAMSLYLVALMLYVFIHGVYVWLLRTFVPSFRWIGEPHVS